MEQDSLPEEVVEQALQPTAEKKIFRRQSLPKEEQEAFVIRKLERDRERSRRSSAWSPEQAQKQREKRARLKQAVIEHTKPQ